MEEYVEALQDRANEQAQMARQHVLMVTHDPALLDVVRVLLQEARYNVTTTNAVPLTFALIAASHPALIIIDLDIVERSGWDLLVRLHAEATTAAIPVVVTARDPRLLAHAQRYPDLFGGQAHLRIPFAAETLLGDIRSLIGAARDEPGGEPRAAG
jgi:DNA-binding response OmpR family regulator